MMRLLTYNWSRVCFQDESVLRKVAIVFAKKSRRAEDLSRQLHVLFTAHEGDGADEKLENIKVLVSYLAAQAGGYNSCCVVNDFGKYSPIVLSSEQMRQVGELSQVLCRTVESVVASTLLDPNLRHSEEFFKTLLTSASAFGHAAAERSGFMEDYVSGLVNNLATVAAARVVGVDFGVRLVSEETKDSLVSDLEDSIAGVVALCHDKWSKFFADKASAQGQKKDRL